MSCTILPAGHDSIRKVADTLKKGHLAAFPTETVYGLGANAQNDMAVAEIYAAKGRPSFNPLIVHVSDAGQAERYAEFTPLARMLAQSFWPGPFTMVLKRKANCPLSHLVSAGLDTVALRVPAHPCAQALLNISGLPIAAPSANRSGRISPTTAQHVQQEFPDYALTVLDGGACTVGLESTVVDATGDAPVLLRPGSVTLDDITAACCKKAVLPGTNDPDAPKAPGMMLSHYAPTIPIRINCASREKDEALLAFGSCPYRGGAILNLSPTGNLKEASANLFAYLRELDQPDHSGIAVMPVPETGLGIAINDRLKRAANK